MKKLVLFGIIFFVSHIFAESKIYNSRIKGFDYLDGNYVGVRLYNIDDNWINGGSAQKESGGFVIPSSNAAGNRLFAILINYFQSNIPVSIIGNGVIVNGKWEEIKAVYVGDARNTEGNYNP